MATQFPFAVSVGSTVGKTVKLTANATPTSVSGTLDCTNTLGTTILVSNNGTVLVFVRVSPQATPVATAADLPIPAGKQVLIANPVPNGKAGLAVLSSTTTAADVYFTPGAGTNMQ